MAGQKKVVHPRQRTCIRCGAKPGEPCVLPTGKPMELIHCTERVVGHPVEPSTWKPPVPAHRRPPDPDAPDQPAATTTATEGPEIKDHKDRKDHKDPAASTEPEEPEPAEKEATTEPTKKPGQPETAEQTGETEEAGHTEVPDDDSLAHSGDPLENLIVDSGSDLFAMPESGRTRKPRVTKKARKASAEPTLF